MTFNQSVLSYRTMKLSWEKHGEETISEVKSLTRVQLFGTPWTVAHQAPPSMEFSRQEYWSELPFPSPGDFPDPRIEPGLPHCRQTLYRLSHKQRRIKRLDIAK